MGRTRPTPVDFPEKHPVRFEKLLIYYSIKQSSINLKESIKRSLQIFNEAKQMVDIASIFRERPSNYERTFNIEERQKRERQRIAAITIQR